MIPEAYYLLFWFFFIYVTGTYWREFNELNALCGIYMKAENCSDAQETKSATSSQTESG